MTDFTMTAYKALISAVKQAYDVRPFCEFVQFDNGSRQACVRHDVDRRFGYAVRCAEVASVAGARCTFYFRYPYTYRPDALPYFERLGHEVGYHYETLSKHRGAIDAAAETFREELAEMRKTSTIRSACMHGAPLSPYDNRDIWQSLTLKEVELVGEPYISLNGTELCYITDTGRGWNKPGVSLRDRLGTHQPRFASTAELIAAIQSGSLPDRLMITIHPERWHAAWLPWVVDAGLQATKNVAKRMLRAARSR